VCERVKELWRKGFVEMSFEPGVEER